MGYRTVDAKRMKSDPAYANWVASIAKEEKVRESSTDRRKKRRNRGRALPVAEAHTMVGVHQ